MKGASMISVAILALGATWLAATPAAAALLAYESFDYPTGSLGGQSGGVGFAGSWSTSAWEVRGGNLLFPSVVSTGNYVQDTGSYPAEAQRLLSAGIDFDTEGVYYLSLLLNKTDGGATAAEPLMVYLAQNNAAAASLGITSGERLMVGADKASLFNTGPAVPASTTVLAVLKLVTHAAAADQYYAWLYEPGETVPWTEPATWDCSYSRAVTGTVCNRLGMLSGNAIGAVDELRLATTWAEAMPVPEPGAGLLLFTGLAWMALRRFGAGRAPKIGRDGSSRAAGHVPGDNRPNAIVALDAPRLEKQAHERRNPQRLAAGNPGSQHLRGPGAGVETHPDAAVPTHRRDPGGTRRRGPVGPHPR